MVLKAASLAQGYSGVRYRLIEYLLALYAADILPCIPAKGSVGASGDLAPLAHLAGVLMGEGEARVDGSVVDAGAALQAASLEPLALGPKEGLALLNGTQVSTALALAALFEAENLVAATVVAGAMSVDGLKGSTAPFDPRIHRLRRQPGQIAVATQYLALLADSEIRDSHRQCAKVQDPYSLRCQPQVMGAVLDSMHHAAAVLLREANAVTDNPLLFPKDMDVLSGGNFHAEPVAIAADILALAIAETGAISERRTAILVDPKMSGLPAFLVKDSGLHSGFMIAQVTAAALASENKTLAHPASVDSLPTSANQEDHVSMATFAARRLHEMVANSATVVGIELLAAAQAIEVHAPARTSPPLQAVVARIREFAPYYERDRRFSPDIEAARALIGAGYFYPGVQEILPSGVVS